MTFKAFPSIEQFRTVIKKVQTKTRFAGLDANGEATYNHTKKLPVLKYKGTVKLHGTNACLHFLPHNIVPICQSRNNVITPDNDNAGFATYMSKISFACIGTCPFLYEHFSNNDDVYIYGEWCGKGIQKGVAISELDKMFVIFDVIVNGDRVKDISHIKLPEHRIFNINDFDTFHCEVDFNAPELVQNTFVALTEQVEAECPVGAHFGVKGVGEGIVWKLDEDFEQFKAGDSELTFKVKGEKHSVSKVKTLAAVDIEKANSLKEFVSNVVTDNRCKQGLDYLREMKLEISVKSIGDFVRWVFNDVMKEESDVITESGLVEREVGANVSKAAKAWYFDNLEG